MFRTDRCQSSWKIRSCCMLVVQVRVVLSFVFVTTLSTLGERYIILQVHTKQKLGVTLDNDAMSSHHYQFMNKMSISSKVHSWIYNSVITLGNNGVKTLDNDSTSSWHHYQVMNKMIISEKAHSWNYNGVIILLKCSSIYSFCLFVYKSCW